MCSLTRSLTIGKQSVLTVPWPGVGETKWGKNS